MTRSIIVRKLKDCFNFGGKVLVCGNGGSAAQSDHFVEELITIGRPAVSLTNPSIITALANDFSYKEVFLRQAKALWACDDILVTFSTSGKSKNVLKAIEWWKAMGSEVIDMPRRGKTTAQIQENQLKLIHQVYEDLKLFAK
jgi:phosphoheptose isomerase